VKLFKTYDINIVKTCQSLFSLGLPSVVIKKRAKKFKDGLWYHVCVKCSNLITIVNFIVYFDYSSLFVFSLHYIVVCSADYVVPRTRTRFWERGFSYCGPAAWKTLPSDLHDITDTGTFRKRLKSVLYGRAYHWLLLALLDVSYSDALQISRWLIEWNKITKLPKLRNYWDELVFTGREWVVPCWQCKACRSSVTRTCPAQAADVC